MDPACLTGNRARFFSWRRVRRAHGGRKFEIHRVVAKTGAEKDREIRKEIVHRLADMDTPEAEAFVNKIFEQE